MKTLLMLGRASSNATLVSIAARLGDGTRRPANLTVEPWETVAELNAKIASHLETGRFERLDIVAHGNRGECAIKGDDPVIYCYRNKCNLKVASAEPALKELRIFSCDFASAIDKDSGWSYRPQLAMNWVAETLRGSQKNLRVGASAEMVEPHYFDETGFNYSSLEMVWAK